MNDTWRIVACPSRVVHLTNVVMNVVRSGVVLDAWSMDYIVPDSRSLVAFFFICYGSLQYNDEIMRTRDKTN